MRKGLLIIFLLLFFSCKNKSNITNETNSNKSDVITNQSSNYSIGLESFKNGYYELAIEYLEKVEKTDSMYNNSQEKIKEIKKIIIDNEKDKKLKDQQKEILYKKYNKLCKSGYYEFEIKNKLLTYGFYQQSSNFEKAPDGSNQIKQIFTKYEYGFDVIFTLQSAYDLNHYYCDVKIENHK